MVKGGGGTAVVVEGSPGSCGMIVTNVQKNPKINRSHPADRIIAQLLANVKYASTLVENILSWQTCRHRQ